VQFLHLCNTINRGHTVNPAYRCTTLSLLDKEIKILAENKLKKRFILNLKVFSSFFTKIKFY